MAEFATVLPYVLCYLIRKKRTGAGIDVEVLLVFRSHTGFGDDHYALVGGKLENNESMLHALIREVDEEIGIAIKAKDAIFSHVIHFQGATRPCMSLIFTVKRWKGEPYNKEPDKHGHIGWFDVNALPSNLLPRHARIIGAIKQGIMYSQEGFEDVKKEDLG